jgi:hypothetical protein
MSLFICQKCGCIENTALCSGDYVPTIYNATVDNVDDFHPHMGGMEMDGHADEDIIVNGKVWKTKDQIMRLCSECNTGTWHGQFNKNQASKEDLAVAKYSKFNMITPHDHEDGCLMETSRGSGDYQVIGTYELLHSMFRDLFGKKHTDHMGDFKDNFFYLAYKVYKEDPMNFRPSDDGSSTNWTNKREVGLWIMDSLVYENESKSRTLFEEFHTEFNFSNNPYARGFFPEFIRVNASKKPHWKEMQTEEDRKARLAVAEAKRLRKANRGK